MTGVHGQPMIELSDVFVLYRGARRDIAALRGLSIEIGAGERVVVHGPSGAGKSTFVKLVTASVVPSAGSALLLGRELTAMDRRARSELRRNSIGTITQHSGDDLSPELTCLENVALQPRLRGWSRAESVAAAHEALRSVGLDHLAKRRPVSLSHGELQRVGIAAALAHRPALVVADEPTGQLDARSADAVFELLAALVDEHGSTLVIASHDESAARIADRVVTISEGRLSTEQRPNSAPTLIVDERGWVRLPDPDRERAGIGLLVSVESTDHSVVLSGTGGVVTAVDDQLDPSVVPGNVLCRVVDASLSVDDVTVLATVSLQLCAGQVHAITGRSGSGKTTLLSIAAGWLAPTTGTVELAADVGVAVCPAVPAFPEGLSVGEILDLTGSVRRLHTPPAENVSLLAALGLAELIDRPADELSGGERQRLAVGRCLAANAGLLLLDEPTAQLDRRNAERVIRLLKDAARHGRAVVCASHDPQLIKRADRVTQLD
jgi:ABC-type lipoprotein export system ATPase subunit